MSDKLFDDEPRKCRECGCTDYSACAGSCYWVEGDLCSRCADDETQLKTFHQFASLGYAITQIAYTNGMTTEALMESVRDLFRANRNVNQGQNYEQ